LTRGLVSLTLPVYAPDETTFKPMAMIELRKLENTYLECALLTWSATPFLVVNVFKMNEKNVKSIAISYRTHQ
jgi:hypothetical protein